MHISQGEIKIAVTFEQPFHCSGKNETRMHVPAVRNKACDLSVSTELNALLFAFRTGIAQNKGEQYIHANNYILTFLYLGQ